MKRLLGITFALVAFAAASRAQFPSVNVSDLQRVPAESLAVADTLTGFSANSTQPRWTLQASPYLGDTVVVTALVAIPPGPITFTMGIWSMLLYDTSANVKEWGGILVRGNAADTTQLKLDGFLNVQAGDIITMTGVISEFPPSRGFSAGQLAPLAGRPITIIGSGPRPKHIVKNVSDFYTGTFSTGKIQYTKGEPFESMLVEFRNVTVNNKVDAARGTFSVVDASGNENSEYDWSRYFTLGHGSTILVPGDTAWKRIYDGIGIGLRIDTLRGVISTVSGQQGPRGYRICPIYPGDVVFAKNPVPPLITTHRRNPVVVTADTTATVSVRVVRQTNGSLPKTVSLFYSVNSASFLELAMPFRAADTTYAAAIPKQAANAFVRYFVQAADSFGQVVRLANSGATGIASDTSKGMFFYTSLNRPLTIQDVQQTPYINGRSPYLGAVIPLTGIITADTSNIGISPVTTGSTSAWFMQSSNLPWNGIWLSTADTSGQKLMAALRNGDSVTVTGTVQEQFDVTRLGAISAVVKHASGRPLPAPVVRTTGSLNVSNGMASAEAYEGMLVKLNNLVVTDIAPTQPDPTEYTVADGLAGGGVLVQRSGKNRYVNLPTDSTAGKTVLRVGNRIGSLTGIVYYSFNQYKFVPRTDADFENVVLTGVERTPGASAPESYSLSQNYPNPFNPATRIRYTLPVAGPTTLRVYNVLGQEVATLVDEVQSAGVYTATFDASALSSGLYFFRVQSGPFRDVKKMMLVK